MIFISFLLTFLYIYINIILFCFILIQSFFFFKKKKKKKKKKKGYYYNIQIKSIENVLLYRIENL